MLSNLSTSSIETTRNTFFAAWEALCAATLVSTFFDTNAALTGKARATEGHHGPRTLPCAEKPPGKDCC